MLTEVLTGHPAWGPGLGPASAGLWSLELRVCGWPQSRGPAVPQGQGLSRR